MWGDTLEGVLGQLRFLVVQDRQGVYVMSWSGWWRSHQLNLYCFPPSTQPIHVNLGFIMAQKNGLEAIEFKSLNADEVVKVSGGVVLWGGVLGQLDELQWVVETTAPKPLLLPSLYPNKPCKNSLSS